MDEAKRPDTSSHEEIPWGQRFFDNHFLLMILCFVIMAVLYTGWGMAEIMLLPEATLP
jgi:hypothetical protein